MCLQDGTPKRQTINPVPHYLITLFYPLGTGFMEVDEFEHILRDQTLMRSYLNVQAYKERRRRWTLDHTKR